MHMQSHVTDMISYGSIGMTGDILYNAIGIE